MLKARGAAAAAAWPWQRVSLEGLCSLWRSWSGKRQRCAGGEGLVAGCAWLGWHWGPGGADGAPRLGSPKALPGPGVSGLRVLSWSLLPSQSTAWPWGEWAEGPLLVPVAMAGCSPGLAPLQGPGLWDALAGSGREVGHDAEVSGRSHIHGCHCHSSARGIQFGHAMAVAVMVF